MRIAPIANCLLGAGLIAACASPEARFARNAEAGRAGMQDLYPPGREWREPADALGAFCRWQCDEPAPDGFSALALEHARTHGSNPHCCWWGVVPRRTVGSSMGAMGLYRDYVFLDSSGLVVVAYRCFLD